MTQSRSDSNPKSVGAKLSRSPLALVLDAVRVLNWYDANARPLIWRTSPVDRQNGMRPDPYRVWLSEIMLQQTGVATVPVYYRKFLAAWPTIHHLAATPVDEVMNKWAGLGYYARARNLHACAAIVSRQMGGEFPQTADRLQELPGIGPYTAAAIAAICHDQKVAVIDGNVERIVARVLALDRPVQNEKSTIRAFVSRSVPVRAGDFAQGLMDIGATICTPRFPSCSRCPLKEGCSSALAGVPEAYPVRPAKSKRPTRFGHAFVLQRPDGSVLLRRRPARGLLAGMSEVPGTRWTEQPLSAVFPPLALEGSSQKAVWKDRGKIVHVFTHFRLELQVWHMQVPGKSEPVPVPRSKAGWCLPADLPEQALPTLFRKVLKQSGVL